MPRTAQPAPAHATGAGCVRVWEWILELQVACRISKVSPIVFYYIVPATARRGRNGGGGEEALLPVGLRSSLRPMANSKFEFDLVRAPQINVRLNATYFFCPEVGRLFCVGFLARGPTRPLSSPRAKNLSRRIFNILDSSLESSESIPIFSVPIR